MSQRRKQRRAKQVRRSNVRAARRSNEPPTPAQIATRLLRDYRAPLESRDPLDTELVASQLMSPGWEQLLAASADDQEQMPHPAMPIISLLRAFDATENPDGLADAALALAHALATADEQDPQVVAAGGVLVEQLRLAGASDPQWLETLGDYELAEAVDIRDVWMSQHQLVLTFRNDAGAEHGLMVLIDRSSGFQIAEIEVIDQPGTAVAEMRTAIEGSDEAPLFRIEELSPARVGGMLQGAFEGTFEAYGELLGEGEDLDLLHLLMKREELLEASVEADQDEANATPFDSDIEELSLEALTERFSASAERAAEPDATDEAIAVVLEWVHQLAYPRALFGPDQIQEVLVGHAPRTVIEEPQRTEIVEPLLAAARAWARWSAGLVGLEAPAVEDAIAAIEHFTPELEQAMAAAPGSMLGAGQHGDLGSVVADLSERMRADDIDLTDEHAVRSWMQENHRS